MGRWLWLLWLALLCCSSPGYAAPRPVVVASFSILGDLVSAVGGDRIVTQVIVGPNQDAHAYQPRPADVTKIKNADLVLINGLGFEGWIERLIAASGYRGAVTRASEGIAGSSIPSGQIDPHAWQSVAAVRIYVDNIYRSLVALDPQGVETYQRNAHHYAQQLAQLEREIVAAIADLPANRRTVVTNHDAFGYFANVYGIRFIAPQGISTESEASARDVAALIKQVRRESIAAIVIENIADPRLMEQITRETGATIGGRLYSDALSEPTGEAGSYLAMMRHNLKTLIHALQPTPQKEAP